MTVLVRTRRTAGRSPRAAVVARRAARMLEALGMPDAELSVLLCDDSTIRELNEQWRQIDRPTDVLAFPQQEPDAIDADAALGDVVISLQTAARQARAARRSTLLEVTALLAHGVLHLLGFDHQTEAQARRMNARADLLVAAAGRVAALRGAKKAPRSCG